MYNIVTIEWSEVSQVYFRGTLDECLQHVEENADVLPFHELSQAPWQLVHDEHMDNPVPYALGYFN